ncbi:MAG: hypothetical protein ACOCUN_00165 [Jiangellaceae bacterium]
MSTFAERKQKATPAEATVHLCLNLRLHDRFRVAYAELQRVRLDGSTGMPAEDEQTTIDQPNPRERVRRLVDQLGEASDAIAEASEPYVFRKLRRHQWRELIEAHPPTDEQQAEWEERRKTDESARRPEIDDETFWPQAIAACSHDPKLTVDDVLWLRDGDGDPDDEDAWPGLPEGEFDRLCSELAELHGRGAVPKEWLDTAQILRRGLSGTTPADGASRSRSSAGGSRKKTSRTG